jgi:hypothetical protein
VLNVNLIVNGDAEGSPGVTNDTSVLAPAGWKASPQFTVVQYGASGDFPALTDPGPTSRGKNFFAGGPDTARSNATQQITLPATIVVSKQHKYYYLVTGYFGGYKNKGDYAVLTVRFITGSGGSLGSKHIGRVNTRDRKNLTSLLLRAAAGSVPAGTRSIDVVLAMYGHKGTYNHGYADNLSLMLNTKPFPVPVGAPPGTRIGG